MSDVQTPVRSGPQEVRIRKGKKGPGSFVTVVTSPSEADTLITHLKKTNTGDVEIFSVDYVPASPETAQSYIERVKADEEKEQKRQAALSKLSDEDKKALGIKV